MGGIRRTLGDALSFERESFSPAAGLRSAIALLGVMLAGLAGLGPAGAVTMGAGALITGLGGRVSGLRRPAVTMLLIAAAMALSTFTGAVSGRVLWIHLVLMALWAGAAGLLSAVSTGAGVIGVQALMAMIVFGRFPEPPAGAARLGALVLAGGAAQVLVASSVHLPPALGRQQRAVAAAYRLLAAAATAAASGSGPPGRPVPTAVGSGPPDRAAGPGELPSSLPAAIALDEAEDALRYPGLFGRPDVASLRGLVDEGRRIRVTMAGLGAAGASPDLLTHAATVLSGVADTLEKGSRRRGDPADPGPAPTPPAGQRAAAALLGQLRAVQSMAAGAADLTPGRLQGLRPSTKRTAALASLRTLGETLRANATVRSPSGRHAVRMGVVVPLASLLADHLPLQRGYWIAVTAAVVLKADFATTFTRGAGRMAGTAAGVAVAGLVGASLHPGQDGSLALIFMLAVAGYSLFQANYAAAIGFITALVVFLLDLLTPDTLGTAADRLVDTLVGGAIALGAYALWPTWSEGEVRASVAELAEADRAYLACALDQSSSYESLRQAARSARLARTRAESAVARSLAEPARHQAATDVARGVLAALRRVVLAVHLIRSDRSPAGEARPDVAGGPAWEALAAGLDDTMAALVSALRAERAGFPPTDPSRSPPTDPSWPAPTDPSGSPPTGPAGLGLPSLRALHDRLDPGSPFWTETDELVDAVNSLCDLLSRPAAGPSPLPPAP